MMNREPAYAIASAFGRQSLTAADEDAWQS